MLPESEQMINLQPLIIQTTLYDLIEAVNESVKPQDDQFVAEIIMDLLNTDNLNLKFIQQNL